MLVLSRKPGEKVFIGNGITLTVVAVNGNKVRIGIEAPNDVPILRAELGSWRHGSMGKPLNPDMEGNPDCSEVVGAGVDQICSF